MVHIMIVFTNLCHSFTDLAFNVLLIRNLDPSLTCGWGNCFERERNDEEKEEKSIASSLVWAREGKGALLGKQVGLPCRPSCL